MSNEPAFTGQTDLDGFARLLVSPVNISDVRFQGGSVTYWHSHEGGQVLAVLGGAGRYQERGGEPRELQPGDTVVASPGVHHWHGAAAGHDLRHIAISSGLTSWYEHPHLDD